MESIAAVHAKGWEALLLPRCARTHTLHCCGECTREHRMEKAQLAQAGGVSPAFHKLCFKRHSTGAHSGLEHIAPCQTNTQPW